MTIQQIYELSIQMAMQADPRGLEGAKKQLERYKKEYEKLSDKDKAYFDTEALINPYSDSRFLYGDPNKQVKKVLAGIDANAAEILLTDRLNQKGEGIDLFIGHHSEGYALAGLQEVLELQIDSFAQHGVPVNVADALMKKRMEEVGRRFRPLNHNQAVDTAKLLDIPLIVLHTIWDNLGDKFMRDYIMDKDYETVGDVFDHIMEIPEFQEARRGKAAPSIVSGNKNSRAGKVVVSFTGGTNPSKEMYMELAKIGVGTYIEMHFKDETIAELKKLHINAIDTGHIAPDSIGANIFLDALEEQGITVTPCSGLIRVKRKKGGKI